MARARPRPRRPQGLKPVRIPKAAAKLLRWERVCRIATAGGTGMPHLVPVCHVLDDGKIYIASGTDGRKVLNLRANPQVALTVDHYSENWSDLSGVMVQGTAALIESGPRFRRIRHLLYAKYPQYPLEAALGDDDSVMIELTPTHVFTWGLD